MAPRNRFLSLHKNVKGVHGQGTVWYRYRHARRRGQNLAEIYLPWVTVNMYLSCLLDKQFGLNCKVTLNLTTVAIRKFLVTLSRVMWSYSVHCGIPATTMVLVSLSKTLQLLLFTHGYKWVSVRVVRDRLLFLRICFYHKIQWLNVFGIGLQFDVFEL